MKDKRLFTNLLFWFALAGSAIGGIARAQQASVFTYQGQLRDRGTNANGLYTLTFKLYDVPTGGNQLGVSTNSLTLANGLFSVNLDFGAGAFNGGARWLDITVQSGTNSQTLVPRVQVLPAPYAQFAAVAATVTNLAINNAQLAPGAVGTTNIQDAAVTTRNLAASAVNATNIGSGQVVKSLNGLTDEVSLAYCREQMWLCSPTATPFKYPPLFQTSECSTQTGFSSFQRT